MPDQHEEKNGRLNHEGGRPERVASLGATSDAEELVRDWQLLFWVFLLSAVGELLGISVWPPRNVVFHLGFCCGLLVAGVLGFAMRYVLTSKL